MKIEWLGHSCFLITAANGTRILTDPFDEKVGLPVPKIKVDVVTVSHQHFDHNATHLLQGKPGVIDTPGKHSLPDYEITGVSLFHDAQDGASRGRDIAFVIAVDGFRVGHLGDLGHALSTEQAAEIGKLDVLCIPVGGFYTIDARQAKEIVDKLKPGVVLPMHYKTKNSQGLPIAGVEDFLRLFFKTERLKSLTLDKPGAGEQPRIVVLEMSKPV